MPYQRRPWRFSLRIALLAITCLCVWLGLQVHRAKRQTTFVKLAEEAGGRVAYRHQVTRDKEGVFVRDKSREPNAPRWIRNLIGDVYFQEVDQVLLSETEITDGWLENLKLVPTIRLLSLRKTAITGSALCHLSGLSDLEVLDLWHCEHAKLEQQDLACIKGLHRLTSLDLTACDVANDALTNISNLRSLKTLSLHGSNRVADDGLAHLQGLTEMTHLWLGSTKATDRGLEQLLQMDKLVWLDVSGTNVTDEGLRHLSGMENLWQLTCQDTQVTESAIKELRAKLTSLELTSAGSGTVW